MKNISNQDYILWDTQRDMPLEDYDTVYHYTTVVDMVNNGFIVEYDKFEFICVAELSMSWQKVISDAIEEIKSL